MVDATVDKSPEEKGEGRWKREQGNPPSTKALEKGTGEQASDTWLKLGAFKERRQSHTL